MFHGQNQCVRKVHCVSSDFTNVRIDSQALISFKTSSGIKMYPRRKPAPDYTMFHGTLLTICMKNESRLTIISVVWHLLLGMDHVFICDHSTPGGVDLRNILRPLVDIGLVTIEGYSGFGAIQQKCYDDALEFARAHGYMWQGGLDADEFLVFSNRFRNVEEFFNAPSSPIFRAKERNIGALGINWIIQPTYLQNIVHYPEDLHTTPAKKVNFVLGQPNRHVKSFAMVNRTKKWEHVHFPQVFTSAEFSTVNTAGNSLSSVDNMFATPPAVTDAAVLHFNFRTVQEHMAKRERGRATLDCASKTSRNDSNCAMVHRIVDSHHGIRLVAEEYYSRHSFQEQPVLSEFGSDFIIVMQKLTSQVEQVILL